MTGAVDWSVLIFVGGMFSTGAVLAWFFSSVITKQNERFEKKIDEQSDHLAKRIDGLDVVSKADRISLQTKIEAFDERDRHEHKEMLEQMTQVRIAISQLETKKERATRTKRK